LSLIPLFCSSIGRSVLRRSARENSGYNMLLKKIFIVSFFVFMALGNISEPVLASPVFPFKDVQDGEPAVKVTLTLVDGVAVDPEGNIYLSHRSKNRIRKVTPDGTITTVAGNGVAGFGGDGGPALKATLNFPAGLALDSNGNLYIADRNNHRIRKVTPDGIITTVAGNGVPDFTGDAGLALQASLNFPSDVALDSRNNLYISDRSNNRIRKVDGNGIITTFAGQGSPGFGGDFGPAKDALLKYPFGICIDVQDSLFIADRGNNRIRRVDGNGIITTFAGDGMHFFSGDYGPAEQASLAYPTDVAKDSQGNVYIADRNNNRIRKVDRTGVITTFMGTGVPEFNGDNEIAVETNLHLPFAITVDAKGDKLIVVDRNHFRVRSAHLRTQGVKTIAGNGESLFKGDGGPGTGATLDAPSGIVIDRKGDILFSEKNHNRIRRIDADGIITTFAGTGSLGNEGDGGPALEAALYLPSMMTLDAEGNIFVACRLGNGWIIRKIDSKGTISRYAGNGIQGDSGDGGPAVEASFYTIADIAMDREGNLFIADQSKFNIRKIDRTGMITRVMGEQLIHLEEEVHLNGLVIDRENRIIFSDSGSSKIRRIDPDGKIAAVAGTGDFKDFGDNGLALQAGIRSPGGLAISPRGELYFCEETSSTIRKIDKNGIISVVAGTGYPGYSGDGGPAALAEIKNPFRLVFDKEGNLYFTDRDNNRVRKIDTSGIITTIAGHGNFGWLQDGLEVRITIQNFP